jgi:hypothetical protein
MLQNKEHHQPKATRRTDLLISEVILKTNEPPIFMSIYLVHLLTIFSMLNQWLIQFRD